MRKGSHLTEEHKQKLREKATGRKLVRTTSHNEKIAAGVLRFNASLGTEELRTRYASCGPDKHSEETKALISSVMRGKAPWNKGKGKGPSPQALERRKHYMMCRNLVRCAVKRGYRKSSHTDEELGYSPDQLRKHLEVRFQPGMTWENWGNNEGDWNIDHIKPCNTFQVGEKPSIVSALPNLRPMWRRENVRRPWDGKDTEEARSDG